MTDTPLNSRTAEVDHFILREVKIGLGDLRKEVRDYHEEAIEVSAALREHVKACDRRYGEMRDAKRGDLPGPAAIHPVVRKLIDKAIDYTIFCVVILIVFAFKHGASMPLPSP